MLLNRTFMILDEDGNHFAEKMTLDGALELLRKLFEVQPCSIYGYTIVPDYICSADLEHESDLTSASKPTPANSYELTTT